MDLFLETDNWDLREHVISIIGGGNRLLDVWSILVWVLEIYGPGVFV